MRLRRTAVAAALGFAALQVTAAARPAAPPEAHLLRLRFTAAAFWFESESGVHTLQGDLDYTNTGRLGFDIVWDEKIFKQPDGHWLEYGFGPPQVRTQSAKVVQQGNLPGTNCSASFDLDTSRLPSPGYITGFSLPAPSGATWNPTSTAVTPGSPCGNNFMHYHSGACWDSFKNCAAVTFSPHFPVPPYPKGEDNAYGRSINAYLISDPKSPQTSQSYTFDVSGANRPPPGTPDTVHSLWFGCMSVTVDPPNPALPAPIDPFTLGGYNPLGPLDNPRPPPSSACSGVKGVSPGSDAKLLAKLEAQEDLRRELASAAWPCLVTAFGIAGTLVSGAGLALPIGYASGILGGASSLSCGPLMQVIALETAIVLEKDPPLRRAGPLALPGCGRLAGASLALCNALRAAATKVVSATQAAASATHDLDIALVAYGTALRRHDKAGAAKNGPGLLQATSRAKSASDAADAARASFYQLIGQAGFGVRMSRAQSAKAIAVMLAKLRSLRVSESVLRKYAGGALTPHATVIVAASVPKPTIASVTFGGSPANPSFVVHGSNLGAQPKPDPPVHPLGTSGCPVTVPGGDDGYDYGTSLYIAVPAKNWAGGRYRPSLNETDCIDLVVTKFTPTEVDFHFGRSYASFYPKFSLDHGDSVEVGVNGATKTVHVKYGATVTG